MLVECASVQTVRAWVLLVSQEPTKSKSGQILIDQRGGSLRNPKHREAGRDEIAERFANLMTWKRGGERAPHKPLLALYALGRLSRGRGRLVRYAEAEAALRDLLREFGPVRRSVHPEHPFWRLQRDGVWEVQSRIPLRAKTGGTNPPRRELLRGESQGGFTPQIDAALRRDPLLVRTIAHTLLDAHFPATLHEDILSAVGLELEAPVYRRRPRNPTFRERVLIAYDQRCAICGFDVRLGGAQIGLDAAHIQWHQAGGPDTVENGLALCVLHHKLFDRGAITVTDSFRVVLSERVHGGGGFDTYVLAFHGAPLRPPQSRRYLPAASFLEWHWREVFQGPARPEPR